MVACSMPVPNQDYAILFLNSAKHDVNIFTEVIDRLGWQSL